ncbi:MAG TPA: gephyrin-like molybdotransferase Glp, partial [Chondromyces sp.]|nr:gephyrin-like molybdotransferase Glp [Chondromyces sp.]
MVEKRKPISVSEAVRRVMEWAGDGESEWVPIEKAYGRSLAEDILARHPVPPFDRSPYDGFAIRSADSAAASRENPVRLRVVGEIGAGSVHLDDVGEFEAVRIMTGAQLPDTCDAVVMLELTEEVQDGEEKYVMIKRPFQKGDNISFQGEDIEEGTVLIQKGEVVTPGAAAVLATFGYSSVQVARKPIVGIFATGSELLDVDEELQPGKIRNSNAYMIMAQIERAGAQAVYFGKFPDHLDLCYEAVKEAAEQVDMLITTGGVSVGDYDYLPVIYKRLEAEVLFNKIGMRPGSVTTVATWKDKILFGLSGNPSACYVGFELLVRPVIRKRMFSKKPHLPKAQATLAEDFLKPNPFTRFIRGKLTSSNGKLIVNPGKFNKSNAVGVLAETDVLTVLPGGT